MEHNKFCVSVHFRNCEPDRLEEVLRAVEAVLAHNKELKATRGRKVLEVRPQVLSIAVKKMLRFYLFRQENKARKRSAEGGTKEASYTESTTL